MSDHQTDPPVMCCLLEICCGPYAAALALEQELAKHATPAAQAAWLRKTFDFAPKGLLTPLLQRAAEMGKRRNQ